MVEISMESVFYNLKRLINQIYKLLPLREEGGDWLTPLNTIIVEIKGLPSVLPECSNSEFELICKLEGLKTLTEEDQFQLYRSIIFDCLKILGDIQKQCKDIVI